LELLLESTDTMRSLYDGAEGDTMADCAPYLVELSPTSKLLERLVLEGWRDAWGIYCSTGASFGDVRRHFRRLLMVELEGERDPVYFRAYDPRVLNHLWPLLTLRQKSTLVAEQMTLLLEGEGGALVQLGGDHASPNA
jgi:hypothetical protein